MSEKGSRRNRGKEQAWRAVLDRQRRSGLSIRAFCRREAISPASFYSWRRELV
jgi:transposase-like protein